MQRELEIMQRIARQAGEIMRQYFYADQQRVIKDDGTPLTIADTTINQMVIEELAREFPDDIVIGEEASTGGYGMGRRWLCDPIDGTKAFTWGVPTAMFSLGLVIDGRPVLGVCYEPMLDRMYVGEIGKGATCNGEVLRVNKHALHKGIIALPSALHDVIDKSYVLQAAERAQASAIFSGAVAKVVRVAEGRFVGYIEHKVNAHDMAASDVIATEAGGRVTGLDGQPLDYSQPFQGAVVSNSLVHDDLLAILAKSS